MLIARRLMPGVRRASHSNVNKPLSSLKTQLLVSISVVILSFVILFGSAWLAAQIIVRSHYFGTNNKDQLISYFLIQSLILLPGVAVVVGILVGYVCSKRGVVVGGNQLVAAVDL